MSGKIKDRLISQTVVESGTSKRLRFHPSYYQSRRGSFVTNNKHDQRIPIRIQKIQKNREDVVLFLAKKTGERFELTSDWSKLDFDYFEIKSPSWIIKLSKK
jgi:hypothetical protein